MNELLRRWAATDLVWLQDAGVGYFPVRDTPYDQDYFDKYAGYSETQLGLDLTAARLELVRRHWQGSILDVGIGCGQFVEAYGPTARGYDVNPAGVVWLQERGLLVNPYFSTVDAATFWDSFEHVQDPASILANVRSAVFMSLPIFADLAHVLRSKHYRRDEHCWYFTRAGLIRFMEAQRFRLLERNEDETLLGREDIESFAFLRC